MHACARRPDQASPESALVALSLAARERIVEAMVATAERQTQAGAKRLAYLSMEFLIGRSLENNLLNMGLLEAAREALPRGVGDFEQIASLESDAALGNGGLGRLAACFLDSLATLDMPGYGYGINYEFGLFQQYFDRGEQRERADQWRDAGSPWLIERAEDAVVIPVYGHVEENVDRDGKHNPMWMDWKIIVGHPFDMPIVGWGGHTVNTLRLFSARASRDFDVEIFNAGDYVRAIDEKIAVESISKLLYPSDASLSGRELRLVQEYFLVACAVRDLFRRLVKTEADLEALPHALAIQLNDTHPALAVAEVMRILVDEHDVPWERAFNLTRQTLAYTNHTLLPEALEKWPVDLLQKVIPRHLQLIMEINRRFLDEVAQRFPGDDARVARMSLIEETPVRQARMAHLAIVGSHSVNGVAALHSELVKTQLVPDFHEMWPERFNNKTNGVTPRRWIKLANPGLAQLIDDTIGPDWIADLGQLRKLEAHSRDSAFLEAFGRVKAANKLRLASLVRELVRETVDPASLFDVQVKRIHEYKRQLLNLLHIVHCYLQVVDHGRLPIQSRTFLFAGKAAPGYHIAKRIIRLIQDVAKVVNADARSRDVMRVVFLPDYRVSLAEKIIPAADLSEQISTAGKEASGTGNMKLGMNGALTIGTLDGANVEMQEEVGEDNIFIFGLKAHEVEAMCRDRSYDPNAYYRQSEALRNTIDAIGSGRFSDGDPDRHQDVIARLMQHGDEYFLLADFEAYVAMQETVSTEYTHSARWLTKSLLNVARLGKFSSDRTITEYASEIWGLKRVP